MPTRRLTEEDVAWLGDDLPYLHPLDPIPALESHRLHARHLLPAFEQELQIVTQELIVSRMGFARARRSVLALLEYQRDAQDLIDWQRDSRVRDSDWNLWGDEGVPNDNEDLLQPNS